MPSISVIIPVYQAETYLKKCVESVVKQTFSDWELLLVDDGCTDDSPAICDACAAEDDRIRVFHKRKNGGVSAARNLGLNEAKGDYIAFLDVDDRFEFRALETMWCLREQTGADTVGCAHLNLYANGNKCVEPLLPSGVYDDQGIREKIVAPLLGDRLTAPVFNGFIWRYLFSAEVIRSARLTFEGAYLEDELFLMEYFCNAKKLAVTEQPLYRYFLNPSSATHRYMKDFQKVFDRFMERKEALVKKYELEKLRPQWRENSNWAGLLIAIGNEYAVGNDISVRKRQKNVQALCQRPDMAKAIAEITPMGLTPNKQMVANLVKGGHFFVLTQMYRLKNRI
ncbi:glycosyltransferase family 2 protein [Dysosmobacter sp.]|uniref:glycosyltransferase family 2 protein n=1 Tax=Dysosmobacter sp. TaxID=2591382 RepID=UPI002A98D99B|nr:glycosyltransferase [Dysosmobacter sp.]MDY5611904.1 glycosyltransferase [Dysosmobacter sp.]